MEGSRTWKMFLVGGDCEAGKVCGKHTPGEGRTRKGPFIDFITFNPPHAPELSTFTEEAN